MSIMQQQFLVTSPSPSFFSISALLLLTSTTTLFMLLICAGEKKKHGNKKKQTKKKRPNTSKKPAKVDDYKLTPPALNTVTDKTSTTTPTPPQTQEQEVKSSTNQMRQLQQQIGTVKSRSAAAVADPSDHPMPWTMDDLPDSGGHSYAETDTSIELEKKKKKKAKKAKEVATLKKKKPKKEDNDDEKSEKREDDDDKKKEDDDDKKKEEDDDGENRDKKEEAKGQKEDKNRRGEEDKKKGEETAKKSAGVPILVAVSPTTLTFDTPTELQTKTLEISNHTDKRVAIKIKSSDAPNFRVDPVFWILEPRSKHTIQITRLICPAKNDLLEVVTAKAAKDVGTEPVQIQAVFTAVDKDKQGIVQVPIQMT